MKNTTKPLLLVTVVLYDQYNGHLYHFENYTSFGVYFWNDRHILINSYGTFSCNIGFIGSFIFSTTPQFTQLCKLVSSIIVSGRNMSE